MDNTIKKQAGYILAFVLGTILLLGQCNRSKILIENKKLKSNINALQDTIKYKENKIGGITASKKALLVSEKELRKEVYFKDERIAKLTKDFITLKSIVKVEQEVKIIEVPIMYKDTIPFKFEKVFNIKEKWYSIEGMSNQKGITISNLNLPNEQFLIIGEKREGIFKSKYLSIDVINTNPNFKTTNITTQVIQVKEPFYNKGWFRTIEVIGAFTLGAWSLK